MVVPIHSATVISKPRNLRKVASTAPMLMAIPLWAGHSLTYRHNVLICGVQGVDDIGDLANTGMVTRSVVILGYAGVQALDMVGPFDVFTGATLNLAARNRPDDGYD